MNWGHPPFIQFNKMNLERDIMRAPKLALEIVDNQKVILVVECPVCRDRSRFLLDEISPETPILCNCGGVLDITDDRLKAIRQQLGNYLTAQD